MNPTPPHSPAPFPFPNPASFAPGDLPPLNALFADYLDKTVGEQTRKRVILHGILTVLGTFLALLLLLFGFVKSGAWSTLPLAFLVVVQGVRALRRSLDAQKKHEQTRRVVQNGVPVIAHLVQANQALFAPGPYPALPCLVLFSFQPEVAEDDEYMAFLAHKLFGYKNTDPSDETAQALAELTTNERAVLYRRRKLPYSFTDGSTVYCADLWIKRAYIPNGHLQDNRLMCLAEPGEAGGLELVPSFLL